MAEPLIGAIDVRDPNAADALLASLRAEPTPKTNGSGAIDVPHIDVRNPNAADDLLASIRAPATPPPETSSALGAGLRGAARSVLPSLAGFGALGTGAELGGAIGAMGGPAAPVTVPVGTVLGGIGGMMAGSTAADWLQSKFLERYADLARRLGQAPEQQQADIAQQPTASFVGELAPQLLTMRPGAVAMAPEAANALERLMANPLGARVISAGIGSGQELLNQEMGPEPVDIGKIGIAAGAGALLNRETALGRTLAGAGAKIVPKGLRLPETTPSEPGNQAQEQQNQQVTPKKPPEGTRAVPATPVAEQQPSEGDWVTIPDAETGEPVVQFNSKTGETRPLASAEEGVKTELEKTISQKQNAAKPPKSEEPVQPMPTASTANAEGPVLPEVPGGVSEEMAGGRGQAAPQIPETAQIGAADQGKSGESTVQPAPGPDLIAQHLGQAGAPQGDGTRQNPVTVTAPEHLEQAGKIVNTEPTPDQKAAGNYQKAHVKVHGLDISIENPKGSIRSGVGPDGKPWSVTMPADYGYIKGTKDNTGEQVDVTVGPNPQSQSAFIVQQHDLKTGAFDEPKSFLGFDTRKQAREAYTQSFSDGKGLQRIGSMEETSVDDFKKRLGEGEFEKPKVEPPVLKNPVPAEYPSKQNLDVVSGKAHADEVEQMELEAAKAKPAKTITPDQARKALKTNIDPETGLRPVGNKALRDMRGRMVLIVQNEKGPLEARKSRGPALSKENSVLANIKALGGVKTTDAAGNRTKEGQDFLAALGDKRIPGLINNKSGVHPDTIRERLKEEGWFGPRSDQGSDIQDLYDMVDREARGERVYHPEVTPPAKAYDPQAHEASLEDRAVETGVRREPSWSLDDWDAAITEREAIQHEASEASTVADQREPEGEQRFDDWRRSDDPLERWAEKNDVPRAGRVEEERGAVEALQQGGERAGPEERNTPRTEGAGEETTGRSEAAPESARPLGEEVGAKPKLFEYGMRYRPPSTATTPKGFESFDANDKRGKFGVVKYTKPLSRQDIESFELDPLDPRDPVNMRKASEARDERVYDTMVRDGRVVAVSKRDPNRKIVLTEGANSRYQVTSFEGDTPTGHREYKNIRGAESHLNNAASEFTGDYEIQVPKPKITEEAGAEDLPQTVLPGAEASEGQAKQAMTERQTAEMKVRQQQSKMRRGGQESAGGMFDEGRNQKTMFSKQRKPVFFSALARGVEGIKAEKLPAAQWKNTIKNLPGIRREEWDWSGIEQWLGDKGTKPVTKQEIGDFLKQNDVQVKEITRGGATRDETRPDQTAQDEYRERWDKLSAEITDLRKQELDAHHSGFTSRSADIERQLGKLEAARNELHDQMVDDTRERLKETGMVGDKPSRYGQYVLPGGENYRELLLTLPEKREPLTKVEAAERDRLAVKGMAKTDAETARLKELNERAGLDSSSKEFRSGHWEERNILAHVRFDDRTGPSGEKVLHVAEVQSDWHQKGRRTGYAEGEPKTISRVEPQQLTVESSEHQWHGTTPDGHKTAVGKGTVDGETEAREYMARYLNSNAARDNMEALTAHRAKVPNAPFKQSWHELAMKRMLRYAAENGYDRLSWDTGETQADRYDLSKQISRIELEDNSSGGIGRPNMEGEFKHGMLDAYDKNGRKVIDSQHVTPETIADVIGKDAAERLLKQEPTEERSAGFGVRRRTLAGQDLKIGGEGQRGFYDKILPEFMNKYAKKFGAKVESGQINAGTLGPLRYEGPTLSMDQLRDAMKSLRGQNAPQAIMDQLNRVRGDVATSVDFKRAMNDHASPALAQHLGGDMVAQKPPDTATHSIPITKPMRDSVLEGQPLFQKGRRGEILPPTNTKTFETNEGETIEMQASPAFQAVRDDVYEGLRARMDELGLHDVGLHVGDALSAVENGQRFELNGVQWTSDLGRELIAVALNSEGSPHFTVNHESIHALRGLGLFTKDEWTTLESHAEAWRETYGIDQKYAELPEHLRNEEAIADAFADWVETRKAPSSAIGKFFRKMWDVLTQIGKAFRSAGFKDADEVFHRIDTGEVGRRSFDEGGDVRGARYSKREDEDIFSRYATEPHPGVVDYLRSKNLALMDRLKGAVSKPAVQESIDDWRKGFQDKYIRVLRLQGVAEKQLGRKLAETENPYQSEELSAGRKGKKLEDLSETMVRPLLTGMHDANISREELEAYLYARHAPERNAQIEKINPKFRGDMLDEAKAGSGMSNEDAQAILDHVAKSGKQTDFEALAGQVDRILKFAVDERVNAGLLSPEQAAAWRGTYEHYVPLRGKNELDPELETTRPRSGGSFNVKGKESQRAFGRTTPARDILPHAIMQAEEAIVRGENNRIAQAFYTLAKAAPEEKFWKTDKVTTRPVWNKDKQQVEYQSVRKLLAEDAHYTVSTKIDGVEHRVTLNKNSPTAVRLADDLKSMGSDQVSKLTQTLGWLNRKLSHVNTTLNPEFVITNAFRDLQEAMGNLQQHDIAGITKGTLKDYFPAMRAAIARQFGKDAGEMGKWYDEFSRAGGRVYFNRIENIGEVRDRLERQLKDISTPFGARKALHTMGRYIENLNMGVENAIRLSAYKNARERGLTQAQAASLAKNLTVNFNRHGSWGPLMNSAYLFYNASVQGSATLLIAAKSPRVRKILASAVAAGAGLELLNSFISGKDEDGESYYDKLQAQEGGRSFILMDPGGSSKAFKFPMPYGYNAFYAMGRSLAQMYEGKSLGEVGGGLLSAINSAFNPIGGASNLIDTISPTVLEPFIDVLAKNKDQFNRPIAPDQPEHGAKIPESQRFWNSTSPVSKELTSTLNSLTGGDAVKPGLVDMSPAVLDYLFGQVAGSAGAFYKRTVVDLPAKLMDKNAEISANDIPFARRVVASKPTWYDRSMFYQRSDEIDQAKKYVMDYAKRGDKEAAKGELEQSRDLLALAPLAQKSRTTLADLRHAQAAAQLAHDKGAITDEKYDATTKKLKDTEDRVIVQFNTQYLKRLKPMANTQDMGQGNGTQGGRRGEQTSQNVGGNTVLPDTVALQRGNGNQVGNGNTAETNPRVADAHNLSSSLKGPVSRTELAEAVKNKDVTRLTVLAANGATWGRKEAVSAARQAGLPITASLLESANLPIRQTA